MKTSSDLFYLVLFVTVVIVTVSVWNIDKNDYVLTIPDRIFTETPVVKTLPDDYLLNLTSLLQQKLTQLKDSGTLRVIEEQRPCTDTEPVHSRCKDSDCPTLDTVQVSPDNIRSAMKPVVQVGTDRLRQAVEAFSLKPETRKYTFVTAASSNHFHESKVAMETLHRNVLPYISNYSIYYYDMGLTGTQRDYIRSNFAAELKLFPFDKFPDRVQYLLCYMWKPLIVQAHIQYTEILVWLDASIQFHQNFTSHFPQVEKTGFLVSVIGLQFAQHVYLGMFSYFEEQPCQYSSYQEVEANLMIFHNEPFTRHLIIAPWSACALDPSCMCPDETLYMLNCPNFRKYGKCHRYDQATIGYILNKLLRRSVQSIIMPNIFHSVEKSDGIKSKLWRALQTVLGIN